MYARHFGLTSDPFSIAPDPRFLFMSERHREALAHLLFGVAGTGGFVLFTGDIGTGKTTVCRCFLEQIPATCQVAMVFNPKLSVLELLQTICEEFQVALAPGALGLKSYVDALNIFLLQSHAIGQSNVLIIDEAQNLLPEVLEQLRLLTNLETHERKLLQIVLIGQPELRTLLQRPDLEQLAQRVIARYHLESLDLADTTHYIAHRLAVAGHSGALPFDQKSLRRIYALTQGVPRRVNLLCGRALLGAFAHGQYQVNCSMVDQAAAEVFAADSGWRGGRTWLPRALAALGLFGALALGLQWGVAALRAAPAVAAVVTTTTVTLPNALPLADVESLLPQLAPDMAQAWRELAPLWKFDPAQGEPCAAAALQQLQCYRASELTLPLLRQLDRPAILTLQQDRQPPRYAMLTGLDAHSAVLQWGGAAHRISLGSLARPWHGEYASYWQPPPGYLAEQRAGTASLALGQLARQLDQRDGHAPSAGAAQALLPDAVLTERIKAFQREQGLKPDGRAGPLTFMAMEKALGGPRPSLQTGSR